MLTRLCPSSATLGCDSTALRRMKKKLYLLKRCLACQAEFDLECVLKKYDLEATSHDQICEKKSCFKAGFGGSIFCKYHLSKWKDQTSPDSELPPLQILRKHLSSFLQVKWTDEPAMGNVLALMDSIYTGKMPTSALSFIDLEFNSHTGKVLEIGMCDAHGKMTMDCWTLYGAEAFEAIARNGAKADRVGDRVLKNLG